MKLRLFLGRCRSWKVGAKWAAGVAFIVSVLTLLFSVPVKSIWMYDQLNQTALRKGGFGQNFPEIQWYKP